jgi:hypothetical protein
MVSRHSMQTPIPHTGARASPLTERREGRPAISTAAAAVVPAATCCGLPLITMVTDSDMCV